MKKTWFCCYTFDYPNRDPDKISAYAFGWPSIVAMGLFIMIFINILVGFLLIVFLGLSLIGIMLWKNHAVFKIKKTQNIPWILSAFLILYIFPLLCAALYCFYGQWIFLPACIISFLLVSYLLFYTLYCWQRKDSMEDSLKQLEMKQYQSFSSLQEKIEKSTEDLKQKLHPDIKYAEFDRWATVPDCLKRVFDILVEDGYRTQKQVDSLSHDTIRINIQKRLRDKNAEKKRDKHADFYKIVDIAEEVSNEFPELQKTMLLAELDRIASPENDLQRAKR